MCRRRGNVQKLIYCNLLNFVILLAIFPILEHTNIGKRFDVLLKDLSTR